MTLSSSIPADTVPPCDSDLPDSLQWLDIGRIPRTSGTAVLVSERSTPDLGLFYLYLAKKRSLSERLLLLSLDWQERAHMHLHEQITVSSWGHGIDWVHMRLGFADTPELHFHLLADPVVSLPATGLRYYLRADNSDGQLREWAWWRRKLLGWMRRFERPAAEAWGLPHDKVTLLVGSRPDCPLELGHGLLDGMAEGAAASSSTE